MASSSVPEVTILLQELKSIWIGALALSTTPGFPFWRRWKEDRRIDYEAIEVHRRVSDFLADEKAGDGYSYPYE